MNAMRGWTWVLISVLATGWMQPALAASRIAFQGALAIPDNSPAGVEAPMSAISPGSFTITDVDVRFIAQAGCSDVVGNVAAPLAHSFIGDLRIALVSPQGTEVVLINRRGGTRNNFCTVSFDDDAGYPSAATISSAIPGALTGGYAPESPLSALDGESALGTWRLRVADLEAGDTGELRQVQLLIRTSGSGNPVIEVDLGGDPAPGPCSPGACSLRRAIDAANAQFGPDLILLPAGEFILSRSGSDDSNSSGDLDIAGDLEIRGADMDTTILRQQASDRVLHVLPPTEDLLLRSLTVTGGRAGSNSGGGLSSAQEAGSQLRCENVRLLDNEAAGGGGLALGTVGLELRNSEFVNNRATGGGGGALAQFTSDETSVGLIRGCVFTGNTSAAAGGAIEFQGPQFTPAPDPRLRIDVSRFEGNSAGQGGALFAYFGELEINDSLLRNNSAAQSGGAVRGSGRVVELRRSLLSDNSAARGGAIHASVEIVDSTLCQNTAAQAGGALFGDGLIQRSLLCANQVTSTNTADEGGGAIRVQGSLRIERSTLDANSALRGGAISVINGSLRLHGNSLIEPSTLPPGSVGSLLRHDNTGSAAGGTALELSNNLLAGRCSFVEIGRVPEQAIFNVESPANSCRLATATSAQGNRTAVSAGLLQLGPLQDNGGPTDSRLPAAASTLVDSGGNFACLSPDQRGYAWVDGVCDVGAVERDGQSPLPDIFRNGFESP